MHVSLISLVVGCSSVEVAPPPVASIAQPTPVAPQPARVAPPADSSWPVSEYLRLGMPDPDRLWLAADYRDCRDTLYKIDLNNHDALPRLDSPKSGPLFARIINPTNTLLLAERFLPSTNRMQLFAEIFNRMPVFQRLYRSGS